MLNFALNPHIAGLSMHDVQTAITQKLIRCDLFVDKIIIFTVIEP